MFVCIKAPNEYLSDLILLLCLPAPVNTFHTKKYTLMVFVLVPKMLYIDYTTEGSKNVRDFVTQLATFSEVQSPPSPVTSDDDDANALFKIMLKLSLATRM